MITLNKISIDKEIVDRRSNCGASIRFRNVKQPNDSKNPVSLDLLNKEGSEFNLGEPKF